MVDRTERDDVITSEDSNIANPDPSELNVNSLLRQDKEALRKLKQKLMHLGGKKWIENY